VYPPIGSASLGVMPRHSVCPPLTDLVRRNRSLGMVSLAVLLSWVVPGRRQFMIPQVPHRQNEMHSFLAPVDGSSSRALARLKVPRVAPSSEGLWDRARGKGPLVHARIPIAPTTKMRFRTSPKRSYEPSRRRPALCLVAAAALTATLVSPNVAQATGTGDPVVAAAGDIACDPGTTPFNDGNGTATKCHMKATSAILQNLLASTNLQGILAVGDTQYQCGGLQAFNQSYGPTWGQSALKAITSPVPGDQEYLTSGGTDCSATPGGGYFSYFGSASGDPSKGYYSFDIGSWHIVALNSVCRQVDGCGRRSGQYEFLQADLAAHPTMCTLAYWHHPRFVSSASGGSTNVAKFWDALYAAGAEVVLGGNQHVYERFAPQTPSQQASATGIVEFVVGTGGKSHGKFSTIQSNSEVRNASAYGVLALTLHPTSYDWQFISEAGQTFSDSGSIACH